MTSDLNNLSSFNEYGGPDEITLGDGSGLTITHIGSSTLHTNTKSFALNNVLHAHALNKNLISVSKFFKTNDVSLEFFPMHFMVKDLRAGVPLFHGNNLNDVYYAPASLSPQLNTTTSSGIATWHNRLGHPSARTLSLVISTNKLCSVPHSLFFHAILANIIKVTNYRLGQILCLVLLLYN